jgi:4-hydroxy-tetrahydrodipicolinate reductase
MTSQTIRISLPGAGGRMGGMLVSEIAKADDLSLVVATDRAGSPHIGLDAGVLAGVGPTDVLVGSDPASLFSDSDVVIDFSAPEASLQHAVLAAETGTAIVIGTTGLSAEQEAV